MSNKVSNHTRPLAQLSLEAMQIAIPKLDRGLTTLEEFDVSSIESGTDPKLISLSQKVGKIITDIFGNNTHEYYQYHAFSTLTRPFRTLGGTFTN
jgi:hypothetical protein